MNYQLYNGELIDSGQPIVGSTNRAFNFGDGFFESIRVFNGTAPFLSLHWQRMQFAAQTLQFNLASRLNYNLFSQHVLKLTESNGLKNARIRFQCFRDGEGKYTPQTDGIGYVATSTELETGLLELNKVGLKVGVFKGAMVNPAPQSTFKSINAIPYILGSKYCQDKGFDDCLMLDHRGNIAETTNSNLFLVHDNTIITPDLKRGGVNGVMRNVVLQVAENAGLQCVLKSISHKDILEADELFLTNATSGLRWVGGMERKRFFKRVSAKLTSHINDLHGLS